MSDTEIVVWVEIGVSDLEKSVAFYNAVFDWDMQINTETPSPTAILGNRTDTCAGTLYQGEPTPGVTVHIAVPDTLAAAKARLVAAGGEIVGDDVSLPFGTFVYTRDLDGNSIGLFEPAA